jgi:hypothetical protein
VLAEERAQELPQALVEVRVRGSPRVLHVAAFLGLAFLAALIAGVFEFERLGA